MTTSSPASRNRDCASVPNGANFSATALAQEGETTGRWRPGKQFNASANLTYRELQIINDGLTTLEPAQTLLGRIDATVNALKGGLRSNTTYEIGAGQEPLVEFVYLFVGAGQGQYIWLDSLYNNDGKIQPNEPTTGKIFPHSRVGGDKCRKYTSDQANPENTRLDRYLCPRSLYTL